MSPRFPQNTQPHPSNQESSLFVSIMRLADMFGSQAEQIIKAAGLTTAQYNVLRILRGAGRDGLACGEIAERMISRDPDITRLLDRMEKQQLITRERQTDDRRVVITCITNAGLQLLQTLDQPVRDLHKKQFERLRPKQLHSLATWLKDLHPNQNDSCEGSSSKAHSTSEKVRPINPSIKSRRMSHEAVQKNRSPRNTDLRSQSSSLRRHRHLEV